MAKVVTAVVGHARQNILRETRLSGYSRALGGSQAIAVTAGKEKAPDLKGTGATLLLYASSLSADRASSGRSPAGRAGKAAVNGNAVTELILAPRTGPRPRSCRPVLPSCLPAPPGLGRAAGQQAYPAGASWLPSGREISFGTRAYARQGFRRTIKVLLRTQVAATVMFAKMPRFGVSAFPLVHGPVQERRTSESG